MSLIYAICNIALVDAAKTTGGKILFKCVTWICERLKELNFNLKRLRVGHNIGIDILYDSIKHPPVFRYLVGGLLLFCSCVQSETPSRLSDWTPNTKLYLEHMFRFGWNDANGRSGQAH